MSYNGSMDFGLLGDYDAMHDLEAFGEMVDDSLHRADRRREEAAALERQRAKPRREAGGEAEAGRQAEGEAAQ